MRKTLVWVLGILCVATMASVARADTGSPGLHDPAYWLTHSPTPGDADNDGTVDVVDLGVLAKNYDRHVYLQIDMMTSPPIVGFGAESGAQSYNPGDIVVHMPMVDLTGDGQVDMVDLGIVAKWTDWVDGTMGTTGGPLYAGIAGNPSGDFNYDHVVDVVDLGIMAKSYGGVGSPVPEPATLSLLAAGMAALIRRKR